MFLYRGKAQAGDGTPAGLSREDKKTAPAPGDGTADGFGIEPNITRMNSPAAG